MADVSTFFVLTDESVKPEVDRLEIDETVRWSIKMTMILRNDFRKHFGLKFANRWGHFIDRCMSIMIGDYSDWMDYPIGDHFMSVVSRAVISSDGRYLFTVSEDMSGTIIKWDLSNLALNNFWMAHKESEEIIECLAYHSGMLLCGGSEGSISLWNSHRCTLKRRLEGSLSSVISVDFNSLGTLIVSSDHFDIRVWSVKTGRNIAVFKGHTSYVTSVLFLGDSVVSGSSDQSIRVWDTIEMKPLRTLKECIPRAVHDLSVNSDASLIACLSGDSLIILSLPDFEMIRQMDMRLRNVCFHPLNPDVLAIVHWRSSVKVYSVREWRLLVPSVGESRLVSHSDIMFTPDGFCMIGLFRDTTMRIWDISSSLTCLSTLK